VIDLSRIADDVVLGNDVSAVALAQIYGCTVGEHDLMPRATREGGSLKTTEDWDLLPARTRRCASTGFSAVILAGVQIAEGTVVAGIPERDLHTLDQGALT
jgi:UDP-2-acetamido-3-amino-2,3-dideoxy-glucuronate N-acetyltransferase